MDPKDLPVGYPSSQQQVPGAPSIPDAPSKVAELFKMFEVAAQAVVVGGNVEKKKAKVEAAQLKAEAKIAAALLKAEEKAEAIAAEKKEDEAAHALSKEKEAEKIAALEAAVATAKKEISFPQGVPGNGTVTHYAPPVPLSQAMKNLMTPAALAAMQAFPEPAAPAPPPVPSAPPAWIPSSVQTKQIQVSKALLKLGFTANLTDTFVQNGAPPAVALALCELILQNAQQVDKKARTEALQEHAKVQASYKEHTDKILHQFQKETAEAKKQAAEMQAAKNDALAQSSAWQSQHDAILKELQTAAKAWAVAPPPVPPPTVPPPPTTVEAAFEGIAQSFRDVWKARMYYVELAVAKLMEEDDKEATWPTMPVSWDVGYGCPGCSASKTMVGVNHPKQGNGYTCSKCKKTWKDPNAPKSQGKKAFFDRITAVKTLVEELGYDLDMALYLVDTAGAQRVLHIAQQVPAVPAPYLAEFKAWADEQNGVGPPKKPVLTAEETQAKVALKKEAIAQVEQDLAVGKVWNAPAPEVTSNVQVLKYTPEALLAKEVQAQPGAPYLPPLSSAYDAIKHTYEHLQSAAKAGFFVNKEKLKNLEEGLAQAAFEEGLTSGMLALNIHDELIPVAALKESNPHLAKIASELLVQQAEPEVPLVVAATPLEVAKFNQPPSSAPIALDAVLNSLAEEDALEALSLIPVAPKKKKK